MKENKQGHFLRGVNKNEICFCRPGTAVSVTTGGLKNSNRGNERLEKRLKANDNVISSEVWHFFRIWMGSA